MTILKPNKSMLTRDICRRVFLNLEKGCDIPAINSGGCGLFALALEKRLTELGIRCQLVVYGYDFDIEKVKGDIPTAFPHVAVSIAGKVYDGYGIVDHKPYSGCIVYPVSRSYLERCIYRATGWNKRVFDVNGGMNALEQKIHLHVSEI